MNETKYQQVLSHFPITEEVVAIRPIGNGHINDTLGVEVKLPTGVQEMKYVLQRINCRIFTDVATLQSNIFRVAEHIRKKLQEKGVPDIERRTLTFIHTNDGKEYTQYEGEYWRLALFIPQSRSYESVTPDLAYRAGQAFGDFHTMLADLPTQLGETIPNFHNMPFRLQELRTAVKNDAAGRVHEVQELLAEIEKRADAMCIQEQYYQQGKLVKRTNHCDTKVNNILFDANTDECLCVIDLDTVMPGFVLSDIGDFIRTAVNTGAEDDENLQNIQVNLEIFQAYTKGYMEEAQRFLTPLKPPSSPTVVAYSPICKRCASLPTTSMVILTTKPTSRPTTSYALRHNLSS